MMKFFKSMVSAIRGGEQAEHDEKYSPSRALRQARTETDKQRVETREAAKRDYRLLLAEAKLNMMFGRRSPKAEAAILRNVADQIEKAADRQGVIEINRARVEDRAAAVTFLGKPPKENPKVRENWKAKYRMRAADRSALPDDQRQHMSEHDKWKATLAAKPEPAPPPAPQTEKTAAGPTPGESMIAKYRDRAAERQAGQSDQPKQTPRGPRMKP